MFAIFKKELKSYFLSPIGYIFIGLFLLIASLFFYVDISLYAMNFGYIFSAMASILTVLIPILTMRMFSEEKRNGTDQLLHTSPVSMLEIVLGKFLAAICILLIAELFSLIYYFILIQYGSQNILISLTTLLGFLLLGTAYISFGMFASSLTENQIISAIITITFFIVSWLLPIINTNLQAFSLMSMFEKFPLGQISITEITTYITFTILFFLLTIIVLQRKKSLK